MAIVKISGDSADVSGVLFGFGTVGGSVFTDWAPFGFTFNSVTYRAPGAYVDKFGSRDSFRVFFSDGITTGQAWPFGDVVVTNLREVWTITVTAAQMGSVIDETIPGLFGFYSPALFGVPYPITNGDELSFEIQGITEDAAPIIGPPVLNTPYSNMTVTLKDALNFDVTTVWSGGVYFIINGLTYELEDVSSVIQGLVCDSGIRNISIVAGNSYGTNSDSFIIQVLSGIPNKIKG